MAILHDFNLCGMDRQMDGPTLLKRCKNSSNNSFKSSTNIQALIFQLCLVRCFKVLFKSSFIANKFGVGYKIPKIVCLVMQKHFIHQGTIVDQNYQLMYFKQGPTLAKCFTKDACKRQLTRPMDGLTCQFMMSK